jgi:hypothetical protein
MSRTWDTSCPLSTMCGDFVAIGCSMTTKSPHIVLRVNWAPG